MSYNILYISHERKMGGANHSLLEMAKGVRDAGNQVSVVVLYRGCPIDRKLREAGIKTFPCFFGWWEQPENWPAFLKLLFRMLHWLQWISVIRISGYVKKNRIQIIHSNSSVIDIGAQVAAKTGCKHVWHFREYGKEDYRLAYMLGKKFSMDYMQKHSDAVVFISNTLCGAFPELKDSGKSCVIYNGVVFDKMLKQTEALAEQKKEKASSVFTFLTTGNISSGKNQKLVIEAANILVNQMKIDRNKFQIYFAGAVTSLAESKKYMYELQECVKKYNLDNVFFKGYVEDMQRLRADVDAEIIPSKSEAYGRVTLEAMLYRNLVIASDSGANPELVGENKTGLLFKNNDASALAEKMQQAMTEDNTKYIDRAFSYVKKVHTKAECYQKVLKLYADVLKEN